MLGEQMVKGRQKATAPESVYQLKVTLLHSKPPIWRQFQVESAVTLHRLHDILQVVMGWTDSHMHGFRVPQPGPRGTRPQFRPLDEADEKSTRLADLLRRPKDRVVYEYDFSDGWEHEIVLEESVARSSDARYPVVLSGRGACPPEDVGGIPGYQRFLMALKNPKHPEHEQMVEWGGEDFDPARFDAQSVNRAFHGGWVPTRPVT